MENECRWKAMTYPWRRVDPRPVGARGMLGILGVLALFLLSLRSGLAQGNPAVLIRQMQARMASLTVTIQQQQQQISAFNTERASMQQRLQRLRQAVNAAAAAGDVRQMWWQAGTAGGRHRGDRAEAVGYLQGVDAGCGTVLRAGGNPAARGF